MGVYINGMEMPKEGYRLILIHADGTVQTTGGETTAVPVPPHGRLIDADALEKEGADIHETYGYFEESIWGFSHDMIRNASTIIPAEPFSNLSKPCKEDEAE